MDIIRKSIGKSTTHTNACALAHTHSSLHIDMYAHMDTKANVLMPTERESDRERFSLCVRVRVRE